LCGPRPLGGVLALGRPSFPDQTNGAAERFRRKCNDPDGSPLENRYLPCGLFLPSRTFPSGPRGRVCGPAEECKSESQFAAKPLEVAIRLTFVSMSIRLADALRIIDAATSKARELGIHVSVAVVDAGAHLVALQRMDGAPPVSPVIAEGKAVGAAMFLRDGAAMLTMANDRPAFYAAVSAMARTRIVPGPGSLLIQRDGAVAGAVGVSGGKPEQDLECAEAGLNAL